ncbi:MAG: alkaline phosphatase family protein [Lentisphaeria bacterium]|nr:alkaline phosphatase family protein [Lentisphaeria bacterium]
MKTILINTVGLTPDMVDSRMPKLKAFSDGGFICPMEGVFPALTTTAQTSMLTGKTASEHGIVGNGWYFRELGEVWLWRQSQRLIDAPLLWQSKDMSVLKHFFWYAMNTDVSATVTPRPAYHSDGRKSPDIYTYPHDLKQQLNEKHGEFPFFNFWGPLADSRSSKWIAESFCTAFDLTNPDLGLCYLPHLDYDLQRFGNDAETLIRNLKELDDIIDIILQHFQEKDCRIIVASEYGIEDVKHAISLNVYLREAGFLSVMKNATGELIDFGSSAAFAVVDHQIAHIYCKDDETSSKVRTLLQGISGVARVLDSDGKAEMGVNHARSGELIAIADEENWFTYDYWLNDQDRPDFANTIDIHNKPGYDPRELFFDPKGGKKRAGLALARKKIGMRYQMNAIPLDTSFVKGSHGRLAKDPQKGPVFISNYKDWERETISMLDISALIQS